MGLKENVQTKENTRLFVRESSGIVRTMGPWQALSVTMGMICLTGAGIVYFSFALGNYPGIHLIPLLLIGFLVCVFNAITYSQIGAAVPRSGADYIITSRVLGPAIGFSTNFLQIIFLAFGLGAPISWIPSVILGSIFKALGNLYNNHTLIQMSAGLSSSNGILIGGTIAILLIWLSMFLPTRVVTRFIGFTLILATVGLMVIAIGLFTTNNASFSANWDKVMGAGAYKAAIPAAKALGMKTVNLAPIMLTMAASLLGFNMFYGLQASTYFAGDLRKSDKTTVFAQVGGLVYLLVLFIMITIATFNIVPKEWLTAEAFLSNSGKSPIPATSFIHMIGIVAHPNWFMFILLALGGVFGLFVNGQAGVLAWSRPIFAWSFDRIVPEWIAYVSPRTGSPVVASTIVCVLCEVGLILSQKTGLGVLMNFTFNVAIVQLIVCIAAMLYPYKKRSLWERGPKYSRSTFMGIPTMTISAGITALLMIFIIISAFGFPGAAGIIDAKSLTFTGGVLAVGFIIYGIAAWYRKNVEGFSLKDTFTEIPPE